MVLGKIARGGAIPHWGVDKRDEFSHVLDRESKIAAAGNEQETLPVGFAVATRAASAFTVSCKSIRGATVVRTETQTGTYLLQTREGKKRKAVTYKCKIR